MMIYYCSKIRSVGSITDGFTYNRPCYAIIIGMKINIFNDLQWNQVEQ